MTAQNKPKTYIQQGTGPEDPQTYAVSRFPARTGDYLLRPAAYPRSMSSIKRDVKKKVLPRPEAEKIFVSTSSPLSVSAPDSARGILLWLVCPSSGFHLSVVTTPIES
jgi:hypothetical protein